MDAQVEKIPFARQSVSVKMVDRQPCIILLDEYKRGAGHNPAVPDFQPFRDRAHESRLAGAQRADQANDRAGKEQAAQSPAQGDRRIEAGKLTDVERMVWSWTAYHARV